MFRYCLSDTSRNLSVWWLLFAGMIYIVSNWPNLVAAKLYNLNIAEFFLVSFSNQYYFLLILFPLLFIFLLRLDWDPSISILSREQKFSSYLKARILTLSLSLVMILFFHILLTFLMGVGLMGTTGTYLTGYAYFDEILQLFSSRFSSPYVAVCLVLLNYLLGLVCVSSIVGVILIYFPRKIRVASLVVLYLIIFFGVQRSAMWNLEPFFISNYVLLSNAITTDLFPGSIVVMLVITILVLSFVCKRWWKAKSW